LLLQQAFFLFQLYRRILDAKSKPLVELEWGVYDCHEELNGYVALFCRRNTGHVNNASIVDDNTPGDVPTEQL